jgi:hypothetical protein
MDDKRHTIHGANIACTIARTAKRRLGQMKDLGQIANFNKRHEARLAADDAT